MSQNLAAVALAVLAAIISFLTARYWVLQAGSIAEAKRLADEHARLEQKVICLDKNLALLKQRLDIAERKCGSRES